MAKLRAGWGNRNHRRLGWTACRTVLVDRKTGIAAYEQKFRHLHQVDVGTVSGQLASDSGTALINSLRLARKLPDRSISRLSLPSGEEHFELN